MYLTEELQKKWQPVLEHPELEAIKDPYKKAVTALVLENQTREMSAAAQQYGHTAQSLHALATTRCSESPRVSWRPVGLS